MRRVLRPALAALTFLTTVPLARVARVDARDVARGAWLFPLVGGGIGALAGLAADVTADQLPALAAGAVAVAVAALVTGAMHLDALADAADALGGRTRERALEIMRDHAVGAFGATALVLVLVLDAALLGALGERDEAALAGLAAGAAGRAAMVAPAAFLPDAREEPGRGRVISGIGSRSAGAAVLLAVLLALPAGAAGLWALAAAAVVTVATSVHARRRLGGLTGDVLGATGKLAETAALLAAAAVLS